MDSESCISNNEQGKKEKTSNSIFNDSDVSEPARFRRGTIDADRFDRILLDCEFGYVLPCGIFLWTLFLLLWK